MQTSEFEIEQQLSRLGCCAADYQQGIRLSEQLEKWRLENLHQLDPQEFSGYRAILALAGMAARARPGSEDDAKDLLHEAVGSVSLPRRKRPRSFEDFADRQMILPLHVPGTEHECFPCEPDEFSLGLLLDLAYYLASIQGGYPPVAERPPRIGLLSGVDRRDLEMEASAALASAEAIMRGGVPLEDFSPLMICIAKAFETEINASLVQWYRNKLGVDMPQFFKLHAPGVSALAGEGRPVDFNAKRRQGHWHPPSLGESLSAGTKHFTEQPRELAPEQFAQLAEIWGHILPLRNRAAHPGPMDRSEFLFGAQQWTHLKKMGLLTNLLHLKARLS